MAEMISEVYEAFLSAGVPEEKARKAVETLTGNRDRLTKIKGDLTIIEWMMWLALAGVALLVLKELFPHLF